MHESNSRLEERGLEALNNSTLMESVRPSVSAAVAL